VTVPAAAPRLVEWGVAGRVFAGEAASGDEHVVAPFHDGVLLAVIDGLGHGMEAATAARKTVAVLAAAAHESLSVLARRCHEALQGTRGAVMSCASFRGSDSSLSWLGIGNVEGILIRANPAAVPPRELLLLRGGVVGYQLPSLQAAVIRIAPGDTLVFATDGLRSDFALDVNCAVPVQAIADRVLSRHAKLTDDALVLVARFPGRAP
jgi:phosphoserine phosphatase RsbX